MTLLHVNQYLLMLAALLGSVLLYGCSGTTLLNAWVPHSGYSLHKNIAYGKDLRAQLDIYVPDSLTKKAPVILFFYGGGWKKGSKDDYRFVGQAFASKGYVTVIADYRLYPEVYFPDFINDTAKAFVWVHQHIENYGGDAQKLFLAGHSAGAYNAMMLTLNDTYLTAAGGKRKWIKGSIGIAGPYDFLPFTDPDIINIFSKKPTALTQPINFVCTKLPPILLLTGDADTEVYPKNSINIAKKLRDYHNEVTTHIYNDVSHISIILALAEGFRSKAPTLEDIDIFIINILTKESL